MSKRINELSEHSNNHDKKPLLWEEERWVRSNIDQRWIDKFDW